MGGFLQNDTQSYEPLIWEFMTKVSRENFSLVVVLWNSLAVFECLIASSALWNASESPSETR